jgi:hypothetical protein
LCKVGVFLKYEIRVLMDIVRRKIAILISLMAAVAVISIATLAIAYSVGSTTA